MILSGSLHEPLTFAWDRRDPYRPWRIWSRGTSRVELTLEPLFARQDALNLGVVASRVCQCFGRFHGRLRLDAAPPIVLDGLIGWAEEHHARW